MTYTTYTICNETLARTIEIRDGAAVTGSLVNVLNGIDYLQSTVQEFEIILKDGDTDLKLSSRDFRVTGVGAAGSSSLRIDCESEVCGEKLKVRIDYKAPEGADFITKQIQVLPVFGSGLTIRRAVMEDLALQGLEGVEPFGRWPEKYLNGEDNVHTGLTRCDASQPERRFSYSNRSRSVLRDIGGKGGLFFFSSNLLGFESWDCERGLVAGQREWTPLNEGLTTGEAVIGGYAGEAEIGFKRYTTYLADHYAVVRDKHLPVSWSTWLVTLADGKPLLGAYTRDFLLEYIDLIAQAGFFDILHLDLGWEADYPLTVDESKYPNGMQEISGKAADKGLGMTYWVNPFSSMYWKSRLEEERPEWQVPGRVMKKSGATSICVLSDFFHDVKNRFEYLVKELNARVIYWDGLDWNVPDCSAKNHGHSCYDELSVRAWKRLAELCDTVHKAHPEAMVVVFSLPFDNHRLCAVDQEQISDTYSFPTIVSELVQRQQLYQMTFEHPYKSIWGSWYGLSWKDAGENNLQRPIEELKHAEMSMIGNGIAQAGGGFDLTQGSPEFMDFLKKLYAFRKRFGDYFDTYQHVLGFPDGESIDGEGHIIDGRGFIVLVNPTRKSLKVRIPLDEPELELSKEAKHAISDWSSLEKATAMGEFTIEEAPELELKPLEVKYIGIGI